MNHFIFHSNKLIRNKLTRLKALVICLLLPLLSIAEVSIDKQSTEKFNSSKAFAFTENLGQLYDEHSKAVNSILYYGHSNGVSVYLEKDKIKFVCTKQDPAGYNTETLRKPSKVEAARMEMEFLGANSEVQIIHNFPKSDYDNFYVPTAPNGLLGVKKYEEIVYKNIYGGIDLVLKCKGTGFEYSFIVNPGANISDIQIRWNGTNDIKEIANEITYKNGLGFVNETGLTAYKYVDSPYKKVQCQVNYKLDKNIIGFEARGWNKQSILAIDPSFSWGTYYGEYGADYIVRIKSDRKRKIYIVGHTSSTSAIASSGAFQKSISGNEDGFFASFDSTGKRQWGTYYGGTNYDGISWADVDTTSGTLYLAGYTYSTSGIASSNAYQTSNNGTVNLMILKFDTLGSRKWGTFYGGNGEEYPYGIVLDKYKKNIYISGYTNSSKSFSSSSAWQTTLGGNTDGFLLKFDTAGNRNWATYIGGTKNDTIKAICRDTSDGVYMCGKTLSNSGIATAGSHQLKISTGIDGFIINFDSSGSRKWGTYYGGTDDDEIDGICNDYKGAIYVCGQTYSASKIATKGAYQVKLGGSMDGLLAGFDYTGNIKWGTYYGGLGDDTWYKIAVDTLRKALYMAGWSYSDSKISTKGSHQPKLAGSFGNPDAILGKFTTSGIPTYVTYYGGVETERLLGLDIDEKGGIYGVGYTDGSKSGIASSGAWQTSFTGLLADGIMVKFSDPYCAVNAKIFGFNNTCVNNIYQYISYNVAPTTYMWSAIGGTIVSGSSNDTTMVKWTTSGIGKLKLTVSNATCSVSDSVQVNINKLPSVNAGNDTAICNGQSISLGSSVISNNVYSWLSKPTGFSSTLSNPLLTPKSNSIYLLTQKDTLTGCSNMDSIMVKVNPLPLVNISNDTTVCFGQTINIGGVPVNNNTYTWVSKPGGYTSLLSNPSFTPKSTSTYLLSQKDTLTGCSNMDSVTIIVNSLPIVKFDKSRIVCLGDSTIIGDTISTKGYFYNWRSNPVSALPSTSSIGVKPTKTTEYFLKVSNSATGCSVNDSLMLTVNSKPDAHWTANLIKRQLSLLPDDTTYNAYYHWDFGDKDSALAHRPIHNYKLDGTYNISLTVVDTSTKCSNSFDSSITILMTYISSESGLSEEISIYPNPFKDKANLSYSIIDKASHIKIEILDLQGKSSALLFDAFENQGNHTYILDANKLNLAAGTYLVRISNGGRKIQRKVIRLKDN
jgi:hypothetical protein